MGGFEQLRNWKAANEAQRVHDERMRDCEPIREGDSNDYTCINCNGNRGAGQSARAKKSYRAVVVRREDGSE